MGAVDQDERSLTDGLEACGPAGRCDALSNRTVRDGESLLTEFGEGGDRERDVFGLEIPQQRRVDLDLSKGPANPQVLAPQVPGAAFRIHVPADDQKGSMDLPAAGLDDGQGGLRDGHSAG